MQLLSAFSRPQTVPAVPKAAPKKTLWILNSWRDLILYVGTPLFLVPMFVLAQARWRSQDIYLFVAAFGAMGHHLPGMIRAYSDRALFRRFRWRFIFAPIFLLGVCVAFYWWDLKGIVLVVFFWGVWHGMMQTYGFCRIYDAKTGSFAALTRRLDFATCAVWFATAVLLSPQRMADTLEMYYASGGPFIPPWLLHNAQQVILAIAIAVAVLFLFNFSRMWAEGKRPNPVKLALLVTTIAFWWYCNNGVTNILAGIALFEVFHDVQYLSLVWIYNRSRVEKDSSIGGFMRFVFRRSGSLVGLYIGLVFAYGSLAYFNSHLGIETVQRVLTGVVAASGLLHFYYDGFIWKVRDRSTRENLGLAAGNTSAPSRELLPGWLLHGAKWVGVFVIPLGALWVGQARSNMPEVEQTARIAADLPSSARAHWKYGFALHNAERLDEAAEQYRIALRLDPKQKEPHFHLGQILAEKSELSEARSELEEALHSDPRNGEYHSGYAYVLELLGQKGEAGAEHVIAIRLAPKSGRNHYEYATFLLRDGKADQAIPEFEAARLAPKSAREHYDYAMLLFEGRKLDQAIPEFEAALKHNPNHPEAHYHLGRALYVKGDYEGAKVHYLETARLDPKAPVHNALGAAYFRLGQTSEAIAQFREALRLNPDDAEAAENLRFVLARDAQGTSTPR
jgi:tetratricopeptide (TPR) repeat protein